MAIRITTKKSYIPIPFEDEDGNELFELRFDMTDENISKIKKLYDDLEKRGELPEDSTLEQQQDVSRESIDTLLGDGAYDKIYEVSNKSLLLTNNYFMQISAGIMREIGASDTAAVLERYANG